MFTDLLEVLLHVRIALLMFQFGESNLVHFEKRSTLSSARQNSSFGLYIVADSGKYERISPDLAAQGGDVIAFLKPLLTCS